MAARIVAVAGSGGFVGRALIPQLCARGYAVRRLARRPASLPPQPGTDDRRFDLDDRGSVEVALEGVDTAFYLVHAMDAGAGFAERDRGYAHRFAAAARAAGVRHVVYLGGLYPRDTELSEHLASRREVGEILQRECGALHIRAGIVIGAGSASFQIMRDLVRRLPVMVTPRWVRNRCQAVEISDVIAGLAGSVEVAGEREVDLAGPEVLSYREMMLRLGDHLDLRRRLILEVPVLTPRLSAHWLRFITSVPLPVAHALVESLRHDAVADGPDLFAELGHRPCGFDEAVRRTLAERQRVLRSEVERRWEGRRYSLVQRFHLSPGLRCDRQLLEGIDAAMRRVTVQAFLHAIRWHGDELRLCRLPVVRLGPTTIDAGADTTVRREIRGGLLTAGEGGELSLSCRVGSGSPVIEARLTGYAPRLPRLLYLAVQEPVHRVLIGIAVHRTIAAG